MDHAHGGLPPQGPESSEKLSKIQKDRAKAVKEYIENRYSGMGTSRESRRQEWSELEEEMENLGLGEADKECKREALRVALRRQSRQARKRITIDDFELLKIIGKGAFGQVRLVKRKDTGELLAMKTMIKSGMILKNQVTHVRAERNILALNTDAPKSQLIDPLGRWIVQLNTSFQDTHNLYLVMEFLAGGDLMGMLIEKDTFSEEATRFYAAEAILAIEAVHALGYIHRDIKPDNFLLDGRGHVKLTDLGLCKKVDNELLPGMDTGNLGAASSQINGAGGRVVGGDLPINAQSTRGSRHNRKLALSTVGTPNYISPEVLVQDGYGMECDWWSLGVILFECLCGYPPFDDDSDPMHVCKNIINWRKTLIFPKESRERLSAECLDFVKKLICSREERLGTERGAIELKQHKWFQSKGPIDFERIHEWEAPYVPEFSEEVDNIFQKLSVLDSNTVEFNELLKRITANFDEYEDEPLPGMAEGRVGGHQRPDPKFLGFTYKPKTTMPSKQVLSSPNSSAQGDTSTVTSPSIAPRRLKNDMNGSFLATD